MPLNIRNKTLTIGASHPQWRQALLYNRHQLVKELQSEGYAIKDIRIMQYHSEVKSLNINEKIVWENHPSRGDVHGICPCSKCGSPSPKGEIELWGKCSFCRRKDLSLNT